MITATLDYPTRMKASLTFDEWITKLNNLTTLNDAVGNDLITLENRLITQELGTPVQNKKDIDTLLTQNNDVSNRIELLKTNLETLKDIIININTKTVEENARVDAIITIDSAITTLLATKTTNSSTINNNFNTLNTTVTTDLTTATTLNTTKDIVLNKLDPIESLYSILSANTNNIKRIYTAISNELAIIQSLINNINSNIISLNNQKSILLTSRSNSQTSSTTLNNRIKTLENNQISFTNKADSIISKNINIINDISELEILFANNNSEIYKRLNTIEPKLVSLTADITVLLTKHTNLISLLTTLQNNINTSKTNITTINNNLTTINNDLININNDNIKFTSLLDNVSKKIKISYPRVMIYLIEYLSATSVKITVSVESLGAETSIQLKLQYKKSTDISYSLYQSVLINTEGLYTFTLDSLINNIQYDFKLLTLGQTHIGNDAVVINNNFTVPKAYDTDINSSIVISGNINTNLTTKIDTTTIPNIIDGVIQDDYILATSNICTAETLEIAQQTNEKPFSKINTIFDIDSTPLNIDLSTITPNSFSVINGKVSELYPSAKILCDIGNKLIEVSIGTTLLTTITVNVPKFKYAYFGKTSPKFLNSKWYLFSDDYEEYEENIGGNFYFNSTDNITWNKTYTHNDISTNNIIFENGTYLALDRRIDATRIIVSDDGDNWEQKDIVAPYNTKSDIIYDGSVFIFVDDISTSKYFYTSYTGHSWLQRQLPTAFAKNGITQGAGVFVVHDITDGNARVFTSNDLIIWTESVTGTFAVGDTLYSKAVYDNGVWLMTCATPNNTKVFKSLDGLNWITITLPNTYTGLCSPLFDGTKWIINDGSYYTNKMFYSVDNGDNWTQITTSNTYTGLSEISYNGTLYIQTDGAINSNKVLYSHDGILWSTAILPSIYTGYSSASYGNNTWVISSGTISSSSVFTSVDGINWKNTDNSTYNENVITCSNFTPALPATPTFVTLSNQSFRYSCTNLTGTKNLQPLVINNITRNNTILKYSCNDVLISGKFIIVESKFKEKDKLKSIYINLYV